MYGYRTDGKADNVKDDTAHYTLQYTIINATVFDFLISGLSEKEINVLTDIYTHF
jgi:hypothetical protein